MVKDLAEINAEKIKELEISLAFVMKILVSFFSGEPFSETKEKFTTFIERIRQMSKELEK